MGNAEQLFDVDFGYPTSAADTLKQQENVMDLLGMGSDSPPAPQPTESLTSVESGTNLELMTDLFSDKAEPITVDLLSGLTDFKPTHVNNSNVENETADVTKTFQGFDPFKNLSGSTEAVGDETNKSDILFDAFISPTCTSGSDNNINQSPNQTHDPMSRWNKISPTQQPMAPTSPGFGGSATNITARGSAAPQKEDPFADFGSFGKPSQSMNAAKMRMNAGMHMGGGMGAMEASAKITSPENSTGQGSWQSSSQRQSKPNYSGSSK